MIHSYFIRNGKLVSKPGYAAGCQWLNIEGVGREEIALLKKLGFHELAIEDILHGGQRMKVEDYKDHLFLVASIVEPNAAPAHFFCFLSKKRIVTVASQKFSEDDETIKRCQKNPVFLSRGPDFILYLLLDAITDAYFPLLDNLDEELDKTEKKLFLHAAKEPVTKLLANKHKVIIFRRNLVALRDLALTLRQCEGRFIRTKNIPYFQDVFDHLVRLSDKTDLMRDTVATTFEAHLSILSNNLNEIMKRLTALTVILMVPTLMAGIYGMNFGFIPVSQHPAGFYGMLGLMVVLIIFFAGYFKKKRWL